MKNALVFWPCNPAALNPELRTPPPPRSLATFGKANNSGARVEARHCGGREPRLRSHRSGQATLRRSAVAGHGIRAEVVGAWGGVGGVGGLSRRWPHSHWTKEKPATLTPPPLHWLLPVYTDSSPSELTPPFTLTPPPLHWSLPLYTDPSPSELTPPFTLTPPPLHWSLPLYTDPSPSELTPPFTMTPPPLHWLLPLYTDSSPSTLTSPPLH
uniref:Uncharacterized protein n=2 Tax=Knipowitschia caucasica TaxID=637954 RepID=A0AAV2L905_KNICA